MVIQERISAWQRETRPNGDADKRLEEEICKVDQLLLLDEDERVKGAAEEDTMSADEWVEALSSLEGANEEMKPDAGSKKNSSKLDKAGLMAENERLRMEIDSLKREVVRLRSNENEGSVTEEGDEQEENENAIPSG